MTMLHRLMVSGAIVGLAATAYAADVETLEPGKPDEQRIARQCREDLRAFDQQFADAGFGVLPPGSYGVTAPSGYYGLLGTPRERIQTLRSAAEVLALQGDEEDCQRLLSQMRATFDEHQELVGAEADDPEARTAWRRAHLANAEPITEMDRLMRADIVIGADVRNTEDEKLGEIEDMVLDPGDRRLVYVLVSRGGFFGFGGELVAVRWQDLRVTADHEIFLLDAARSVFEEAPAVDAAGFAHIAGQGWRQQVDQFWDERLEG